MLHEPAFGTSNCQPSHLLIVVEQLSVRSATLGEITPESHLNVCAIWYKDGIGSASFVLEPTATGSCSGGVPDLSKVGWNNVISSVKVYARSCSLHDPINYGNPLDFYDNPGSPTAKNFFVSSTMNDRGSSLKCRE